MKFTELYGNDLEAFLNVFDHLDKVTGSLGLGVHEIEIRVRTYEDGNWAVIGWGESGDPCILRFESDPQPPPSVVKLPNLFLHNSNFPKTPCEIQEHMKNKEA
jgi:hypothetical protein